MHKTSCYKETPHKPAMRERLHEYIEIRKTTPISVVDVIAAFCALSCLAFTIYFLLVGTS